MTSLEIAKALGVTEGTKKTFEFPEPVVFSQKRKGMPERQYTITSAIVINEKDWNGIILGGTSRSAQTLGGQRDCALNWFQLLAPAKRFFEKALLKSNA